MIVCHCVQVNDRRLIEEIRAGALDHDDLASTCGAGGRCGGCRPVIDQLLASITLTGQSAA